MADRESTNLRLLQGVAAFFIAIKVAYIFTVGPTSDEAYYWLWGQHPGLSYFDHPPFQAWLLGISDFVLGRSLFSLRWLTLATLGGTFYIFHLWAKRYAGANWRTPFWKSVVIYLASTTFGFFTSLAMHDYMLMFLCLIAGHFFLSYLTDFRERGVGRVPQLYLGALFLGLAGLTKYNAVFLGLGVFFFIVFSRPMRPLLRSPHLYLAAALAIALQAPVLIWNYQHGFASFGFHLIDRHPQGWLERMKPDWVIDFVFVSLLLVSPFLVPVFVRFLVAKPATTFEQTAKGLAGWVFWLSSLTFLYIALFDSVFWWWNLVAYVLVLPFAGKYMGKHLLRGHVALGAGLALYLLVSSAVVPVMMLFGQSDGFRAQLYGWDQLAAPIAAARAAHPAQFVGGLSLETTSYVAFAIDDPDAVALTPWRDQFDYWFDPRAHGGENVIMVLRAGEDEARMATMFNTVTLLETLPVDRFGYRLDAFEIYYAEGFKPESMGP